MVLDNQDAMSMHYIFHLCLARPYKNLTRYPMKDNKVEKKVTEHKTCVSTQIIPATFLAL